MFSSRTNNISESYNHQINGQVDNSKSNVYKVLDVVKKQEALTSTKYERVNLGQEKKTVTAQMVKDNQIALLENQYKHGEIEIIDFLEKCSQYVKNFD